MPNPIIPRFRKPLTGAGPQWWRRVGPTAINYPARWGLISHWKLDEASGVALDAQDGNNLTDNNTVTSAAGKVGTARQFTSANSEYLSIADNAGLSAGDMDFWLAGWVWFDTVAGTQVLWAKGVVQEYELLFATTLRFRIAGGGSNVDMISTVPIAAGQWYFVMGWHDAIANTVNIRINHGAVESRSAGIVAPGDTTAEFRLGARGDGFYFNGRLDETSFGKSPPGGLTAVADEISGRLYASGAGRAFPWA